MAITSFPFDNQDTTESQYGTLFRELQDSGVVDSITGPGFRVNGDATGMNVKVQPGVAIIRGHAVTSTAVETLTVAGAEALARIDRVILRLDPAANNIVLVVKKGVAGGAVPALAQTDTGLYEIPLALIAVAAGTTNIAAGNVTSERQFVGMRTRSWSSTTRPTSPRVGQLGLNTTRGQWEFWSTAGAWTDLAPAINWTTIEGKPGTFPPTSHTHPWSQLTQVPATFPPTIHAHDWAAITGKPATFPPTAHDHAVHAYAVHVEQGTSVQTEINWLHNNKSPITHGHDIYPLVTHRSDGTGRAHAVAIGGGGNWYSVWVDGGGWFCRNTSSIRYKENVRDVDFNADDVLALVPRIYDRKDDLDPDGNPREGRRNEMGLIAEEVFQTMPELVQFEDGEIDSVRYDLVGVALLKVVQKQEKQIAELTRRLDELA